MDSKIGYDTNNISGIGSSISNNDSFSKINYYTSSAEEIIHGGIDTANNILKLTFSQAGIIRSMGKIINSENRNFKSINQKIGYTTEMLSTKISEDLNDYVFMCGDYYLPLSFNFSVSGNTNLVKSQLVDGIQIIENTYYEPQIIDINIKIERAPDTNSESNPVLNFRDSRKLQIVKLGEFLKSLRKDNPVFSITNNYISKDLGINYCTLERYSITPIEGSTITHVNLRIIEVDLTTQTLFVNG